MEQITSLLSICAAIILGFSGCSSQKNISEIKLNQVGYYPQQEKVVIWVDDTGLGIPEKEQEIVFKKFYKAGSTRAHKSGTGLGLTITKNIVELHNGDIKIESKEGRGTKVSLIFPVSKK